MMLYIKVNHLLNLKLSKYLQIVPMFRVEPANKGNNLLSLQKGTNSKHSPKILWRYVRLRHRGPTSVKPRLTLANCGSAGINRGWTSVQPRLSRGSMAV